MPRFDQSTLDFMEKVSGQLPEAEHKDDGSLRALRTARQVAKALENPKKSLAKAVIRTVIDSGINKEGSIKILDLYSFLNDKYQKDWWDWEPETIWKMLEYDHLDATPEELKNMAMALQLTLNTFYPFEHWHIFEKVGHAFNSNVVNFSVLQPLEPEEIALTMHVLGKIRPRTDYDLEVKIYIATCAKVAGLVFLPEELFPSIQGHLDDITFEHGLRDKVKDLWNKGQSGDAASEKIQIDHLRSIAEYVKKLGA